MWDGVEVNVRVGVKVLEGVGVAVGLFVDALLNDMLNVGLGVPDEVGVGVRPPKRDSRKSNVSKKRCIIVVSKRNVTTNLSTPLHNFFRGH